LHCIFRWNGSGCYQFVGKNGTDWDLGSGIGPCGLVNAGDSGNIKGIQGSCVVQEAEAFFDTADALAARMVVKDDQNHIIPFYVNFPYNAYPTVDPISNSFIGEEGGF